MTDAPVGGLNHHQDEEDGREREESLVKSVVEDAVRDALQIHARETEEASPDSRNDNTCRASDEVDGSTVPTTGPRSVYDGSDADRRLRAQLKENAVLRRELQRAQRAQVEAAESGTRAQLAQWENVEHEHLARVWRLEHEPMIDDWRRGEQQRAVRAERELQSARNEDALKRLQARYETETAAEEARQRREDDEEAAAMASAEHSYRRLRLGQTTPLSPNASLRPVSTSMSTVAPVTKRELADAIEEARLVQQDAFESRLREAEETFVSEAVATRKDRKAQLARETDQRTSALRETRDAERRTHTTDRTRQEAEEGRARKQRALTRKDSVRRGYLHFADRSAFQQQRANASPPTSPTTSALRSPTATDGNGTFTSTRTRGSTVPSDEAVEAGVARERELAAAKARMDAEHEQRRLKEREDAAKHAKQHRQAREAYAAQEAERRQTDEAKMAETNRRRREFLDRATAVREDRRRLQHQLEQARMAQLRIALDPLSALPAHTTTPSTKSVSPGATEESREKEEEEEERTASNEAAAAAKEPNEEFEALEENDEREQEREAHKAESEDHASSPEPQQEGPRRSSTPPLSPSALRARQQRLWAEDTAKAKEQQALHQKQVAAAERQAEEEALHHFHTVRGTGGTLFRQVEAAREAHQRVFAERRRRDALRKAQERESHKTGVVASVRARVAEGRHASMAAQEEALLRRAEDAWGRRDQAQAQRAHTAMHSAPTKLRHALFTPPLRTASSATQSIHKGRMSSTNHSRTKAATPSAFSRLLREEEDSAGVGPAQPTTADDPPPPSTSADVSDEGANHRDAVPEETTTEQQQQQQRDDEDCSVVVDDEERREDDEPSTQEEGSPPARRRSAASLPPLGGDRGSRQPPPPTTTTTTSRRSRPMSSTTNASTTAGHHLQTPQANTTNASGAFTTARTNASSVAALPAMAPRVVERGPWVRSLSDHPTKRSIETRRREGKTSDAVLTEAQRLAVLLEEAEELRKENALRLTKGDKERQKSKPWAPAPRRGMTASIVAHRDAAQPRVVPAPDGAVKGSSPHLTQPSLLKHAAMLGVLEELRNAEVAHAVSEFGQEATMMVRHMQHSPVRGCGPRLYDGEKLAVQREKFAERKAEEEEEVRSKRERMIHGGRTRQEEELVGRVSDAALARREATAAKQHRAVEARFVNVTSSPTRLTLSEDARAEASDRLYSAKPNPPKPKPIPPVQTKGGKALAAQPPRSKAEQDRVLRDLYARDLENEKRRSASLERAYLQPLAHTKKETKAQLADAAAKLHEGKPSSPPVAH